MRVGKWWQNCNFWVNHSFKAGMTTAYVLCLQARSVSFRMLTCFWVRRRSPAYRASCQHWNLPTSIASLWSLLLKMWMEKHSALWSSTGLSLKTHNETFARNAHNGWLWNRTSDSRNVDSKYGISKQLSEYLAFLSILFIFLMTLANITVHCNRDIKVTTVVTLMEIFFCKVLAFWGLRISCYLKMLG